MQRSALLMLIPGLVLLGTGAVLQWTGGPPRADAALVQGCQAEMTARHAEPSLIAQCSDTAFATTMTATDPAAAARAISAANNSEIGGDTLAMLLLGIGLALTIGGGVMLQKRAG